MMSVPVPFDPSKVLRFSCQWSSRWWPSPEHKHFPSPCRPVLLSATHNEGAAASVSKATADGVCWASSSCIKTPRVVIFMARRRQCRPAAAAGPWCRDFTGKKDGAFVISTIPHHEKGGGWVAPLNDLPRVQSPGPILFTFARLAASLNLMLPFVKQTATTPIYKYMCVSVPVFVVCCLLNARPEWMEFQAKKLLLKNSLLTVA